MTTPNNPGGDGYNNYGQWGDQSQQGWQDPNQNQQYGQAPNYAAPAAGGSSDTGFFKALFDLEFNHFVTIKFAKVIYLIILVFIGLGFAGGVIAAIAMAVGTTSDSNAGMGFIVFVLVLLASAVISLLYLVMARVSLEFYVAGIRTAQNTGEIRDNVAQRNF